MKTSEMQTLLRLLLILDDRKKKWKNFPELAESDMFRNAKQLKKALHIATSCGLVSVKEMSHHHYYKLRGLGRKFLVYCREDEVE